VIRDADDDDNEEQRNTHPSHWHFHAQKDDLGAITGLPTVRQVLMTSSPDLTDSSFRVFSPKSIFFYLSNYRANSDNTVTKLRVG
jgi:hypothetical protein